MTLVASSDSEGPSHRPRIPLIEYSDSEDSDDEQPQSRTVKPTSQSAPTGSAAATTSTSSTSTFTVNKANPRKIQVKLQDAPSEHGQHDDQPPAKRQRVGGGAFSGFNALLPPPKRDAEAKPTAKPAARKVFSLKTGAEPGFSRESDAELRNLFAEQDAERTKGTATGGNDEVPSIPTPPRDSAPPPQVVKGNAFMFKPLSVARGKQKKKTGGALAKLHQTGDRDHSSSPSTTSPKPPPVEPQAPRPPTKISLFSTGVDSIPADMPDPLSDHEDVPADIEEPLTDVNVDAVHPDASAAQSQSLDTIASDLNLSASARRQLFGRAGASTGKAINVVNFNTDVEYAANEVLRASGEQVQHNPVRAIAPGKHSLKQLVSAAQGQKDALEESFATGRRNKKEAGSKYGW